MSNQQLSLAFEARDRGISRVTSHNSAFVESARAIAREICRQKGVCTIDDVRERMTDRPSHPNAYGAIFKGGEFVAVDIQPSRQIQGHGRFIRSWRLRD